MLEDDFNRTLEEGGLCKQATEAALLARRAVAHARKDECRRGYRSNTHRRAVAHARKDECRRGYRSNTPNNTVKRRLLRFHDRAGHMEPTCMRAALQAEVDAGKKNDLGLKPEDVRHWDHHWCAVCAMCKTENQSFGKTKEDKPTHSNDVWYTDTNGPDNFKDMRGNRYRQVFVDGYDSLGCVYSMPDKKGETLLKVLKLHAAWAEIDSRKFPDYIERGRREYGVWGSLWQQCWPTGLDAEQTHWTPENCP